MTRFLLVCAGGALGSGARYLISTAVPHGTLVVNVVGSFAIAMVMELMRASDLRLLVVTGVLGGFTTYSAFNQETIQHLENGAMGRAAVNVGGTVAACLVAGGLGMWVARLVR